MTDREHRLTALEWRLYIVAALAAMYVVTWRVLDRPPATASEPNAHEPIAEPARVTEPVASEPAPSAPPVVQPARAVTATEHKRREPPRAPMPAERPRPRAVWLDELPPERRPTVTPPTGWVVTRRDAIAASAPPSAPPPSAGAPRAPVTRVIRVPAKRRVRTRSS